MSASQLLSVFLAAFLWLPAAALASKVPIEVKAAHFNPNKELEVTVNYGGGCGELQIELTKPACIENTSPLNCNISVSATGSDPCEADITRDLTFTLSELGLDSPVFAGGVLKLWGHNSILYDRAENKVYLFPVIVNIPE